MTNIWWLKFEEGLNFWKNYIKIGCSRLKWNWYKLIIFFVCWLGLKTQPWSYSCQAKQFPWYFWGQYWGRATMSSGIYQKISVPSNILFFQFCSKHITVLYILCTNVFSSNYRIVTSRSTCYYSGNQKFCFLKSRLLTCRIFFLGTKLFCFSR